MSGQEARDRSRIIICCSNFGSKQTEDLTRLLNTCSGRVSEGCIISPSFPDPDSYLDAGDVFSPSLCEFWSFSSFPDYDMSCFFPAGDHRPASRFPRVMSRKLIAYHFALFSHHVESSVFFLLPLRLLGILVSEAQSADSLLRLWSGCSL